MDQTLWISIAIAYLFNGWAFVVQDLLADPINRPMWAFRPTLGTLLITGLLWPVRTPLKMLHLRGGLGRGIAFGVLTTLIQMLTVTTFVWGCMLAAGYFIENPILQVITGIGLVLFTAQMALPLMNLIAMPLMFILMWPIDLLFPLKEDR